MRLSIPKSAKPASLCVLAVLSAVLMGQGCPGSDGGGGGGTVTGQYIGATECKVCHSRVHDTWAMTMHAKAFDTLKAIGQDTNAACIGCHVVGYGEDGGFVDEATTPQLAGVQCESCHGAGLDHRSNVADKTLRPPKSMAATVCGKCHNGFHHPTYDNWASTKHARVEPDVAASISNGTNLNNCGVCHSGDFRQMSLIDGDTVPDTALAGTPTDQLNGVTCAVCHDPHEQTGNNALPPDPGHDAQLRYVEIKTSDAVNTIAGVQNADRFNLCGQCHHSRGRVWTSTSRGPHPSVQSNMYIGEMAVPDGVTLLLANQRSVHRFVPKQCVTCHMVQHPFVDEEHPAYTGHGLEIDYAGCTAVGCHPSEDSAQTDQENLEASVKSRLEAIAARLGDESTWGYSAEGGPADQSGISDTVKKVRFLYYYVIEDGSYGVHNPEYTKAILDEAEALLTSAGM